MELTGILRTSRANAPEDRGYTVEIVSWVLGRRLSGRDRRKSDVRLSDATHLKHAFRVGKGGTPERAR